MFGARNFTIVFGRGGVGKQKTADLAAALRRGKGWQRLVKREVHTLKKAEYQVGGVGRKGRGGIG